MNNQTPIWRTHNLPHPSAKGKHNYAVQAHPFAIKNETIIDQDHRRIVIEFIMPLFMRHPKAFKRPNIHDSQLKVGLHIRQTGRVSIAFLDECIFKIIRSRRWSKSDPYVKMLKLNLERIEIDQDYLADLQEVVGRQI